MLRCSDAPMPGCSDSPRRHFSGQRVAYLISWLGQGQAARWPGGSMARWLGGLGLSQLVNTWRRASSHMDPRIYAISAGWESGGPFGVLVAQALDFVFVNKFRTSFFLTISLNFFYHLFHPSASAAIALANHQPEKPHSGRLARRSFPAFPFACHLTPPDFYNRLV